MTGFLPQDFHGMCLRCFHYAGPDGEHKPKTCLMARERKVFSYHEMIELTTYVHPSWFEA